jgi:transposase
MISMEAFMDIFALKRQVLKVRGIARKLGKHRNTVKKYLESGTIPQYR